MKKGTKRLLITLIVVVLVVVIAFLAVFVLAKTKTKYIVVKDS